jgi:hypothetical protein
MPHKNPFPKVGSLITAYHKGFHEVLRTGISTDCVEYRQKFTSKGKPYNGATYVCHADYVWPVTIESLDKEIAERQKEIKWLEAMKQCLS